MIGAKGIVIVALAGCASPRPTVSFEHVDYVSVAPYPRSLSSADIDADGGVDFAVAIGGSQLIELVHMSLDGMVSDQSDLSIADLPEEVEFGDFDGDGDPDLIATLLNFGPPEVFLTESGFVSETPIQGHPAINLEALEIAAVDRDANIDLAGVDGDDDENLAWQPGNGDGTFGEWQKVPMNAGDLRTTRVGDINGDGILDLSGSSFWSGQVSVSLGNGDGTFGTPLVASLDQMNTSHTLLDLDGDGDLELAVGGTRGLDVNRKGARTLVVLDPDDGELRELSRLEMDAWDFASGDLDHDGYDDLLVAGWEGHVYLMQSLGDGSFTAPEKVATAILAADIEITQIDGEGPLDFAFVDNHGGGLWIYLGEYR